VKSRFGVSRGFPPSGQPFALEPTERPVRGLRLYIRPGRAAAYRAPLKAAREMEPGPARAPTRRQSSPGECSTNRCCAERWPLRERLRSARLHAQSMQWQLPSCLRRDARRPCPTRPGFPLCSRPPLWLGGKKSGSYGSARSCYAGSKATTLGNATKRGGLAGDT